MQKFLRLLALSMFMVGTVAYVGCEQADTKTENKKEDKKDDKKADDKKDNKTSQTNEPDADGLVLVSLKVPAMH